jgi:hypothetical protein
MGVDGLDKYGKQVKLRCRYVTTNADSIIAKARIIMAEHRLKASQTLPDYFNPADIGAWRLAGHIGY